MQFREIYFAYEGSKKVVGGKSLFPKSIRILKSWTNTICMCIMYVLTVERLEVIQAMINLSPKYEQNMGKCILQFCQIQFGKIHLKLKHILHIPIWTNTFYNQHFVVHLFGNKRWFRQGTKLYKIWENCSMTLAFTFFITDLINK